MGYTPNWLETSKKKNDYLFENAKVKLCIIDGSTYYLRATKQEFLEYCEILISEKLDFNEFYVKKMTLKEINSALDQILEKLQINYKDI